MIITNDRSAAGGGNLEPLRDPDFVRRLREPAFLGDRELPDAPSTVNGAEYPSQGSRLGWFYPVTVGIVALLALFWWNRLAPVQASSPEDALAVAPPPPPEVVELLTAAGRQIDGDRLTTPTGDNALESYRAVLAIDPDNGDAKSGIARIATIYAQWAQIAERRGNKARALRHLQKALSATPDDPTLRAELQRLERSG